MKKVPKPSPAMVVALLALVLAAGGTATAALTGKDKGKVRSVVDQEIAKAAPGLSVASAAQAQNAANAATAANATNAANAGNAAALGGVSPGGYVQSFGGHLAADTTTGTIFTVPQLQVSILPDSSPASSADFRVQNNSSGLVAVDDTKERLGTTLFTVAANSTSGDRGGTEPGEMALTSAAHPDLVLLFSCFSGVSDAYCTGELVSAPAR
jgi:hypothetical protein